MSLGNPTSGGFSSPATGNLDMDGNDIILDADGNSKFDIEDDYLALYQGGTLKYGFYGNILTVPGTIDMQSGGNGNTLIQGNATNMTFYVGGSIAGYLSSDGIEAYAGRLTGGTLTQTKLTQLRHAISTFTWTNAMVTALGAVTLGDVAVCTLPAKTFVTNAYIVITTPETALAGTFTVALGRTGAAYIDYIVASSAKAAANTIYGDASGERGTNLTGYDLPSYTGTTLINIHFISSIGNLDTAIGSTGKIILETATIP